MSDDSEHMTFVRLIFAGPLGLGAVVASQLIMLDQLSGARSAALTLLAVAIPFTTWGLMATYAASEFSTAARAFGFGGALLCIVAFGLAMYAAQRDTAVLFLAAVMFISIAEVLHMRAAERAAKKGEATEQKPPAQS